MQLARDELLAGPALPHDQDTARNRRDAREGVTQRTHRGAVTDERRVAVKPRLQRSQLADQLPARHGVFDFLDHALDRLRLIDESVRPQPHRLHTAVVTAGARVNDHRRVDAALLQAAQDLEPVDPWHLQIEDHAIDRFARQDIERLIAAGGNRSVVLADAFQVVGILLRHRRNIVDHQNVARHVRVRPLAGISTAMRVPLPGSLSTASVPLRSITSRRTMERPSPVPPSFVV